MNTFNSTIFSKTILSLGVLLRMAGFLLIMKAAGDILLMHLVHIPSDFSTHPEKLALVPNIQVILASVQGIGMICGFIVLPLLYLKFFNSSEPPTELFKPVRKEPIFIITSIGLLLVSLPLAEQCALWNKEMSLPDLLSSTEQIMREQEKVAAVLTDILVNYQGILNFILVFVVVSIIPAFGEELVFRGIVQNELIRIWNKKHYAIWVTGFIFSFIHFQFFGFVPRLLLGVLLGYCYLWTNSLWVPIAMHFANNTLTLIISTFFQNSLLNQSQQENTTFDIRFFIAYIVAQVIFLFLYYKFIRQQQMKGK